MSHGFARVLARAVGVNYSAHIKQNRVAAKNRQVVYASQILNLGSPLRRSGESRHAIVNLSCQISNRLYCCILHSLRWARNSKFDQMSSFVSSPLPAPFTNQRAWRKPMECPFTPNLMLIGASWHLRWAKTPNGTHFKIQHPVVSQPSDA